jgi:hypothetical protein
LKQLGSEKSEKNFKKKNIKKWVWNFKYHILSFMVFNANLQQYFSYIMTASFIGGGNRGKPPIIGTTDNR